MPRENERLLSRPDQKRAALKLAHGTPKWTTQKPGVVPFTKLLHQSPNRRRRREVMRRRQDDVLQHCLETFWLQGLSEMPGACKDFRRYRPSPRILVKHSCIGTPSARSRRRRQGRGTARRATRACSTSCGWSGAAFGAEHSRRSFWQRGAHGTGRLRQKLELNLRAADLFVSVKRNDCLPAASLNLNQRPKASCMVV